MPEAFQVEEGDLEAEVGREVVAINVSIKIIQFLSQILPEAGVRRQ